MLTNLVLPALGSIAIASAQSVVQGPPPPASTLSMTQSGVLPVLPTPFAGVATEEGAIIYDGPMNPNFVGPGGAAVAQTSLPMTSFKATLPGMMFDPYAGSTITGSITGVGTAAGVQFTVSFTGFPASSYGPFVYHIHGLAVPANGNCTATMGHLDPTDRGEYYPCPPTMPQNCQAGDLAGKHGNITGSSFTATYVDPYLSTVPGSPYYFGDKSIVIHTMNTTRLTCANFVQISGSNSTSNATSTASATVSGPTSSPTTKPYTGAASVVSGSLFGAVAAGILAFIL